MEVKEVLVLLLKWKFCYQTSIQLLISSFIVTMSHLSQSAKALSTSRIIQIKRTVIYN